MFEVLYKDGKTKTFESLSLDHKTSQQVFNRTGEISQIHAEITSSYLK